MKKYKVVFEVEDTRKKTKRQDTVVIPARSESQAQFLAQRYARFCYVSFPLCRVTVNIISIIEVGQ